MADFTVTSCTVSRSVMTPEDTVDITLTAKNNFGSKLTKFGLNLCFTNADRGLSGNGYWVPVVQAETSISWANGASSAPSAPQPRQSPVLLRICLKKPRTAASKRPLSHKRTPVTYG